MVRILILSEDGHPAFEVISNVLRLLLRKSHLETVSFLPTAETKVREASKANAWKGSNYALRTALVRAIAAHLKQPGGIVVFHFDGDTVWAERNSSATSGQFSDSIELRVKQLLMESMDSAEADSSLKKLVRLIPFYSIESWTYQATACALEICRAKHRSRHVAEFTSWGEDRSLLDEVFQPKKQTCLSDKHNVELSLRIPVEPCLTVRKSLFSFNEQLGLVPDLQEHLKYFSPTLS